MLATEVNGAPSQHVVETTVLPDRVGRSTKVTKMQLLGSGASAHVYVGTDTDLHRVPVQTCSASYSSCCHCVASRDPYCGFDPISGNCVALGSTDSRQGLLQDLVGGNSDVCTVGTSSGSVGETQPSSSETAPTTAAVASILACSGGVVPGGGPNTDAGSVLDSTTATAAVTGPGEEQHKLGA